MFRKKYLIEVNYKSGIQKQFWVYKYNFKTKGGAPIEASWEPVSDPAPVVMNIDSVESIWQIRESRLWV